MSVKRRSLKCNECLNKETIIIKQNQKIQEFKELNYILEQKHVLDLQQFNFIISELKEINQILEIKYKVELGQLNGVVSGLESYNDTLKQRNKTDLQQ